MVADYLSGTWERPMITFTVTIHGPFHISAGESGDGADNVVDRDNPLPASSLKGLMRAAPPTSWPARHPDRRRLRCSRPSRLPVAVERRARRGAGVRQIRPDQGRSGRSRRARIPRHRRERLEHPRHIRGDATAQDAGRAGDPASTRSARLWPRGQRSRWSSSPRIGVGLHHRRPGVDPGS